MSKNYDLNGIDSTVELGKAGPRLKDSSGVIDARNSADSAFVEIRGADATTADAFTTLRQLDEFEAGRKWIDPVRLVESSSNLALTGEQTIDGFLTSADRVLLTAQSTASENGVWVTAAGAWSRPADFATAGLAANKTMMVEEGTVRADSQWTCNTDSGSDTIDTDPLSFTLIFNGTIGVASIGADAGATGENPFTSGSAPTPTTKGFTGGTGLDVATVGQDIEYSVSNAGIGTTQLAGGAVTEAKIADDTLLLLRKATIADTDAGSTVNLGAILPSQPGFALRVMVAVTVAFDVAVTCEVGHSGDTDQLMTSAQVDLGAVGVYVVDIYESVGGFQLQANLGAGAPTVGSAKVIVEWMREA